MIRKAVASAVAAAFVLGTIGMSFAGGTDTPVVDQRQVNQQKRIDQGVQSGQLTQKEADRMSAQQQRIAEREEKMKADGVVTGKEKARLHRQQERASKNIYKQKHDRQRVTQ
jgi:hypothetical protein